MYSPAPVHLLEKLWRRAEREEGKEQRRKSVWECRKKWRGREERRDEGTRIEEREMTVQVEEVRWKKCAIKKSIEKRKD